MAKKKTLEQLKNDVEVAQARYNRAKAANRKARKKATENAERVIGKRVVKLFDDDFTRIDILKLDSYLKKYQRAILNAADIGVRSVEDADKQFRAFRTCKKKIQNTEEEEQVQVEMSTCEVDEPNDYYYDYKE